jgi:solute carrier family 6 GABA transporter-like protein 1
MRIFKTLAPDSKKDEDGRDNFNSRTQFVLCAMGGAVGLGNLLRFPSVVFNNYGLQFFIPYACALFLIGIPILTLQIVIGQAYRAGCVTAWNKLNHRAKGIGFAEVFNGWSVATYYVAILAWAMTYFRMSFISPLPWTGRDTEEFFYEEVIRNGFPEGGEDGGMLSYPDRGMVGETVGWTVFVWFLVWLCMFKGVGLTGRVIYITMALPLIMIGILAIRSLSLPNASDGYRLYVGVWRTESLRGRAVWQDAFGQMFFSIGVGFGYFTSYASYSSKFSNAVQDAWIIACTNSCIEIVAALAVMGIVGYLGLDPDSGTRLSTFSSGFFTYPEALAELPGSNFFSVLFFLTLLLLGLTSAFALFDVVVTLICDTDFGGRFPRWMVVSGCTIACILISLIYCTEFGFFVLDAVDTFVNDLALFFTVWCEAAFATTLYRWRDPVDQIGIASYSLFNGGYFFAHFIGLLVGHLVSAEAGAGVAFGIFIVGTVAATVFGKAPTIPAPGFWGNNVMTSRLWYAAFYSGNQLRRDMNRAIVTGKNWRLHWSWPVMLKYITAPAVGLVFTFAYPKFIENNWDKDPPYLYSFILFHIVMIFIVGLFIFPKFFNMLVPAHRRDEGKYDVQPQYTIGETPVIVSGGIEAGERAVSDSPRTSTEVTTENKRV